MFLIFNFNISEIPLVSNRKHLSVIISNDAKWNCHIESILQNVAKYISTLRKLKYLFTLVNDLRPGYDDNARVFPGFHVFTHGIQ